MSEQTSAKSRPARILIVEDERHIARFLEFILKKEGYQIKIAYDGEQGLAALNEQEPDAVLLNLVLPGISGLEVLKGLRANDRYANLPVAILTSRPFEEVPATALAAGASFHCTRPIAPSTLIKKLVEYNVPPKIPDLSGNAYD
ncbi:MAG TPA: response regulator [Blastocatellia bacterium]|nr:response regulator [Blastocatellia bacterium]